MMTQAIVPWVARLRDADPDVRREAIRQLELLGEPAALGPLAVVFAADPVPELREFARRAGKAIYYAALKRAEDRQRSDEQERQRAAEILKKAQTKKQNRR